ARRSEDNCRTSANRPATARSMEDCSASGWPNRVAADKPRNCLRDRPNKSSAAALACSICPRSFSSKTDVASKSNASTFIICSTGAGRAGGPARPPPPEPAAAGSRRRTWLTTSQAVVHVELDRVGGHAQTLHFAFLLGQVGIDHVVAEHAAAGQELAVLVQRLERLVQRRAHGRDLGVFFRRQVVQVLVGRIAGVDLVLHAVQAG